MALNVTKDVPIAPIEICEHAVVKGIGQSQLVIE